MKSQVKSAENSDRSSSVNSIRVIVVDDHPLIRAGLRAMLSGSQIKIVAEATSADEAISAVQNIDADVILMDVRLGEDDGIKITQAIMEFSPNARVLIVSSFESDGYLREAVRVGASGYILKGASRTTLEDSIRDVASGKKIFNETALLRIVRSKQHGSVTGEKLSQREQEILWLICKGHTNIEISGHLNLSNGTVKKNIQALFSKLGVQNRTEAAMKGVQLGVGESMDAGQSI